MLIQRPEEATLGFVPTDCNISGVTRQTIAVVTGSKGNVYEVKKHELYGLSCECMAWITNHRGNRTCKHTELVKQELRGGR